MKKDEIYKYLAEYSNRMRKLSPDSLEAFTTGSIEKKFTIKTNIANYHLNQLHKEGKLIKINTKPVYYLPLPLVEKAVGVTPSKSVYRSIGELEADKASNSLKQIIGSSGSLEECIRQCKVAIHYPGNGLPLLLKGPTGTGKTFLAKCLFRYAVQEGILCENAPFFIFNCAEYANNPELLGSKLFGHVKGAFTGADREVAGMIENADNGILLIDEVHRLSPENQEKLFMFMDDGVFRRIGENSGTRKANVRLIFATTEDLNALLLQTFLRRIPIIVKVPPMDQRGSMEKKAFIYHFFQQQSKILSKEIHVELPVVSYLTSMPPEGNVGGLENVIKYTCANAYLESKKSDHILIKLHHLPVSPKDHLPVDFMGGKPEVVKIDGNRIENHPMLTRKMEGYMQMVRELRGLFKDVLSEKMRLSRYRQQAFKCIGKYLEKCHMEIEINDRQHFIAESVKNALTLIANQYHIQFDPNCIRRIAEYVAEIPASLPEDSFKEKWEQKVLSDLFSFHYEWCHSFIKVMQQLNARYPIHYQDMDILVMITIFDYYSNQKGMTRIKAVIISHGYSMAGSLADTANKFIGENVYRAFDIPGEASFGETGKNLKNYFRHMDTRDGVIILTDFGEMAELHKEISKAVQGDIGLIDNVSAKLAIDVGQRILNEEPMAKIVDESVKSNITRSQIIRTQRKKEKVLIVTCQTGMGTAFKIKQLLEQCFTETVLLDVIVSEYSRLIRDKGELSIFSRYEVIGIIGTADPKVPQVPFVGIEDLMDQQGAEKLQALFHGHLSRDEIQELNNKLIRSLSKENIVNLLTILNPDKILLYIEEMVHQWEKDFEIIFPNNLVISLYVHLSSMIERVITHNEMTFHENQQKYEAEHPYFFEAMNKAFEEIERNYHTAIPNSEIAYIYDIFKLKIPNFQF